jgi:hypothetical protein
MARGLGDIAGGGAFRVSATTQKTTGKQTGKYDSDNNAMYFHNSFGVMREWPNEKS